MQDLVAPQDRPATDSENRIKSAELKIVRLTENFQKNKDEINQIIKDQ